VKQIRGCWPRWFLARSKRDAESGEVDAEPIWSVPRSKLSVKPYGLDD